MGYGEKNFGFLWFFAGSAGIGGFPRLSGFRRGFRLAAGQVIVSGGYPSNADEVNHTGLIVKVAAKAKVRDNYDDVQHLGYGAP